MEAKKRFGMRVEEWKKRSELGDVCGIFGCEGKPSVFCSHCGNWYCDEHSFVLQLPSHPINGGNIWKGG